MKDDGSRHFDDVFLMIFFVDVRILSDWIVFNRVEIQDDWILLGFVLPKTPAAKAVKSVKSKAGFNWRDGTVGPYWFDKRQLRSEVSFEVLVYKNTWHKIKHITRVEELHWWCRQTTASPPVPTSPALPTQMDGVLQIDGATLEGDGAWFVENKAETGWNQLWEETDCSWHWPLFTVDLWTWHFQRWHGEVEHQVADNCYETLQPMLPHYIEQ